MTVPLWAVALVFVVLPLAGLLCMWMEDFMKVRSHVARALIGVLVIFVTAMMSLRCRTSLPPVAGCTPGTSRCSDDRPQVCSATQRWEPVGDEACAAVGGVCLVRDGGAHCGRVVDGGASEGGAR